MSNELTRRCVKVHTEPVSSPNDRAGRLRPTTPSGVPALLFRFPRLPLQATLFCCCGQISAHGEFFAIGEWLSLRRGKWPAGGCIRRQLEIGFTLNYHAPMHKRVTGVWVSQNGEQTYNVLLDLELNPVRADEESEPLGWIATSRRLAPGHKVSEGNYTLQPHENSPESKKVHLKGQRLIVGWL